MDTTGTPQEILLAGNAPPTEVRIFRPGVNRTLKGDFTFTPRSAELVAKQWQTLGRDIGFDWGHSQFKDGVPEKHREASGWGKVEIRDTADGPECWITGIDWCQDAREQIADKRMRYLSPALIVDPDTGEIIAVKNVALTNNPATLDAEPLVLDAEPPDLTPPEEVRAAVKKGLALRDQHKHAGTEGPVTQVARALTAEGPVTPRTVRRMAAFFSRHGLDKQIAGWGSEEHPTPGYIAWLCNGGDPGQRWAVDRIAALERAKVALTAEDEEVLELDTLMQAAAEAALAEWLRRQAAAEQGVARLDATTPCAATVSSTLDAEPSVGHPVPFRAYPAHEAGAWDAAAAEKRMQERAGWTQPPTPAAKKRYAEGFAYVKGNGDRLSDYVLPHHDVIAGKLVTSWPGLKAAGAAIQGAHGNAPDIPTADLPAVKRHLASHYHQFKRRAPWEAPPADRHLQATNKEATPMSHDPKHVTLAKTAAHHLSGLMKCGADMAESAHPVMAPMGKLLAEMAPMHLSALREQFGEEMDPEDGEAYESAAAGMPKIGEETIKVVKHLEAILGKGPGLLGRLLALEAKAAAPRASGDAAHMAKVEEGIKAGKIHASKREMFLALDATNLEAYLKAAPVAFPTNQKEPEGAPIELTAPPDVDPKVQKQIELDAEAIWTAAEKQRNNAIWRA